VVPASIHHSNHALPLTHPKNMFMQGIGQTADTSVSVVPTSIHHSNHALSLTYPKTMFMQGIGQTADTSVSMVPASIHHSSHALPLTHPKNMFMQGIGQTADTSVSVVPASIHHSNHALPLTHPKNTTEERLSTSIIFERKFTYGFSPGSKKTGSVLLNALTSTAGPLTFTIFDSKYLPKCHFSERFFLRGLFGL
jgi:hypothetical protein